MAAPSAEWKPLFRSGPFLDLIGPLYYRDLKDGAFVIGLGIEQKHCNARETAHGGVLATLADIALGYVSAFSQDPPAALTTANLSIDYAGAVTLGSWLEAHVDIQRIGGRAAFANAYLISNETRVARASAVFIRGEGKLAGT